MHNSKSAVGWWVPGWAPRSVGLPAVAAAPNGRDCRRLGRRRDRRVQPAPELRLPLRRLCRAWRVPLDTGALRPLGRMAAGPLRTVLEGCFKGMAVGCNCPKSATIVTTVWGVITYLARLAHAQDPSAVSTLYPMQQWATNALASVASRE